MEVDNNLAWIADQAFSALDGVFGRATKSKQSFVTVQKAVLDAHPTHSEIQKKYIISIPHEALR